MNTSKILRAFMYGCGAAAVGLPALSASLPPAAAPYALAAHGSLVFLYGILAAELNAQSTSDPPPPMPAPVAVPPSPAPAAKVSA